MQLIEGNCFDILPTLPQGSFDAIVTDPPYNISKEGRNIRRTGGKFGNEKPLLADFGEWDKFDTPDSYINWTECWVRAALQTLKPIGTFISYFPKRYVNSLEDILEAQGMTLRHQYADCKTNPAPQARKVGWRSGWEMAVIAVRGNPYQWEQGQESDWGSRPVVLGKERYAHPTQKPLSTIGKFLRWWTPSDAVVIDPFAGTGTTGLAAAQTGRDAILIERDATYCNIIRERLGVLLNG